MSEAFVTFREALEAVLVVGILMRYAPMLQRAYVWGGVLLAVVVSLLGAWMLHAVASANALWEIGLSFLAAVLLLYMVVWMRKRAAAESRYLQGVAQQGEGLVLLFASFSAVAREGLETVIFLRALWHMQAGLSWVGGIVGLLVAIGLGLLVFGFARKVPLRKFFNLSSILLLLIAAGMASYAVHELLELLEGRYEWATALAEAKAWSIFPPKTSVEPKWAWAYAYHAGQYFPPLHHKGWIGAFLHALTGWRASMTWAEVGIWLVTFLGGLWLWRRAAPKA